jgi:murein DD-endopeptidase MepM/ murein hydrolase activator NlpD
LHARVPMRVVAFFAAVVVGVAGGFPALSAGASPNVPPFEITFPQETSKTDFRDTYGDSRSGGRSHKGSDLLAPRMTEVYSIADGIVSYVGTNNLSGRNLKIDHGGGWESYYVHLNNDNVGTDDGSAPWSLTVALGVEEGAFVEAGQLIAWVGDSGNAESTTPHTHFELRLDGQSLNPYPLLVDAYERDSLGERAIRRDISLPGFGVK